MNPLISVIVPIYNVEKYLCQCVDSIINQTYNNLEIILVDDGSPDNCPAICDEYAEKDSRIKVIHKKNGGLSDARNAGLRAMSGDYLMFVDSDDYLDSSAIELLYNLSIDNNADLVIGGHLKFDEDTGNIINRPNYDNEELVLSQTDAMKSVFTGGCAAWARLYKKEIHKGIFFPVGKINEDEAIVLEILERCQCVVCSNQIVYYYRYRNQSITSSKWDTKKLDWCNHCLQNMKYINSKHPELFFWAKRRYFLSIVWALNNMTADVKHFKGEIKKYKAELRRLMREKKLIHSVSAKDKIRIYMLAYCFNCYSCLVNFLGKKYT